MNLEGKEQNIGAGKLRTAEPKTRQQAQNKELTKKKGRREEMLMKMEGGWMISPLEVWNAPR